VTIRQREKAAQKGLFGLDKNAMSTAPLTAAKHAGERNHQQ
jgi:hypothetical protein